MRKRKWIGLVALALGTMLLKAQPTSENKNLCVVPTYECAGLYWKSDNTGTCTVRYKEPTKGEWKEAMDLVYDQRDNSREYRGSLVGLLPNREYTVELTTPTAKESLNFKTRNDRFPIGRTTELEPFSTQTQTIKVSGNEQGYHLVTVPKNAKAVIDVKNQFPNCLVIDADYVIVRGLQLHNASKNAILIKGKHHNIVIEDCNITCWGGIGGSRSMGNFDGAYDSGIYAEKSTSNLTIQRNLIENPRGAANSWQGGHPDGPQGITVFQSLGGNVIRYNDIVSTEDHPFNDGIGGGNNFSFEGNMNCDSDIYGNYIISCMDDAIECEGANTNVRIFGNYIGRFYNGIATASTSKGPLYIYRNVAGESRQAFNYSNGGAFIKTGERKEFGGGIRYIFHNTVLQPLGVMNIYSDHPCPNVISKNNFYDAPGRLANNKEGTGSSYENDFFSGITTGTANIKGGIDSKTTPSSTQFFVRSQGLEFIPRASILAVMWGKHDLAFGHKIEQLTDPVVWKKNPLIDSGVRIRGINDGYKGEAPEIGAFEVGAAPLQFGRRAYLHYDQGWTPWDKYW